jgi:hypothetical protein
MARRATIWHLSTDGWVMVEEPVRLVQSMCARLTVWGGRAATGHGIFGAHSKNGMLCGECMQAPE